MTRLSKLALLLVFLMIFSLLSLYSLRYLPIKIVEDVLISGGPKSYEIAKMTASLPGLSYYRIRRGALEDNIEKLSYVESAKSGIKNGSLKLDIAFKDGLILESGKSSYFLTDDEISLISKRDAESLKDEYFTLTISDSFLEYIARFGIDSYLKSTIDSLKSIKEYHSLIDKAEYDNNKVTGKGELSLTLNSLNATFKTSDSVDSGRLISSLKIIRDEQEKSDMFFASPVNYELRANQLVRLKG